MNISDMLSKMDPKMLQEGLKNLSSMLSPQQMKQMEETLSSIDAGSISEKLKGLDLDAIQKELQNNPGLVRDIQKDPEAMKKIGEILSK